MQHYIMLFLKYVLPGLVLAGIVVWLLWKWPQIVQLFSQWHLEQSIARQQKRVAYQKELLERFKKASTHDRHIATLYEPIMKLEEPERSKKMKMLLDAWEE